VHLLTDTSRAFLAPPHFKDPEGSLLFRDDKAGSEVVKSAMMKLFEHVLRVGHRRAAPDVPHVPNPALDVEMSEIQRTTTLNPTSADSTTGAIIRDGRGLRRSLPSASLAASAKSTLRAVSPTRLIAFGAFR